MTIQRIAETDLQTFGTSIKVYEDSTDPQLTGKSTISVASDDGFVTAINHKRQVSGTAQDRWQTGITSSPEAGLYGDSQLNTYAYDNNGDYIGLMFQLDRNLTVVGNDYNPHVEFFVRNVEIFNNNPLSEAKGHIDLKLNAGNTTDLNSEAQIQFNKETAVGSAVWEHRWSVVMDDAAETGGNAGSSYNITRYDDAGISISNPIVIDREHGTVKMNDLLKLPVRTEASVPAGALEDGLVILDPTGKLKFYFGGQWRTVTSTP